MSVRGNKPKKPHGQIRRSQLVTMFGPGSMIDLPKHAVMVAGLDDWIRGEQIQEPRLTAKLAALLQIPYLVLHAPRHDDENPNSKQADGVSCWQFPQWFIVRGATQTDPGRSKRSRRLVGLNLLIQGEFLDDDKKRKPVAPIRFVRACRKGHIGDIDWSYFVHQGGTDCRRELWYDERGTSGDLSEAWVRCDCGAERPIIEATKLDLRALGRCDGRQPWLGGHVHEPCDEPNRLLVRSASNAYFPQTMSVISIPDRDQALSKAVDQVWEHYLQYVADRDELEGERNRKPPIKAALEGFSTDDVMAHLAARREGREGADKSVKEAEFETLASARDAIGQDAPDGDFFARALPRKDWNALWMKGVERVVLVHRLREVIAAVGFTRFESTGPDVEGELELGVVRAPLAREIEWLPAVENRGEGVFIQFSSKAVDDWTKKPAVQKRGEGLVEGFDLWENDHKETNRQFFGLPYTLLHSLSHQLITAVSLECGYPASSIRERIYAGSYGYGILLYTATPDAEGTMGGLVGAGRSIARHLRSALELGRLCSNDPVCAQHDPRNPHERRFLHGAACHGCLLIAETSCEQRNDFLDRALVVSTLADAGAEFFDEPDE